MSSGTDSENAARAADLAQQESLKLDIVRYMCRIQRKDEPIIRTETILFEIDVKNHSASMEINDANHKYVFSSLNINEQKYDMKGNRANARINRQAGFINLTYGNGVYHSGVCVPHRT